MHILSTGTAVKRRRKEKKVLHIEREEKESDHVEMLKTNTDRRKKIFFSIF